MIVKARIKTNPIEQWSVGREYRRRLKKSFDARGIEIPCPHRTLYFGEASPAFRFVQDAEQPGRGRCGNYLGGRGRPSQPTEDERRQFPFLA